ncbi:MAG: hypothetical protein ABJC79_16315 [Acidimicrobiia bacterium]
MLSPIPDVDVYVTTRTSWHTLAERVLAPARHGATGRIGLRPAEAGVTTPPFDGRTITITGTELSITDRSNTTRSPITTLRAAAEAVGIDPGADTGVFTPTTPAGPDAPLVVDPAMAQILTDWFGFGQRVLSDFGASRPDDTPSEIQLWPEHFDLALDLGSEAGRANYGASPGDAGYQLPYLYVGPWNPDDHPFWNAGSFARLGYSELLSAPDPAVRAAAFFSEGYAAANS